MDSYVQLCRVLCGPDPTVEILPNFYLIISPLPFTFDIRGISNHDVTASGFDQILKIQIRSNFFNRIRYYFKNKVRIRQPCFQIDLSSKQKNHMKTGQDC